MSGNSFRGRPKIVEELASALNSANVASAALRPSRNLATSSFNEGELLDALAIGPALAISVRAESIDFLIASSSSVAESRLIGDITVVRDFDTVRLRFDAR